MRRNAKIDLNQPEVVSALREAGASVTILSTVGHGVPDLLVGYDGRNYLLEVKYQKGDLTDDQVIWHGAWLGKAHIVRSPADALRVIRPYD